MRNFQNVQPQYFTIILSIRHCHQHQHQRNNINNGKPKFPHCCCRSFWLKLQSFSNNTFVSLISVFLHQQNSSTEKFTQIVFMKGLKPTHKLK
ncbi:CLUMA_CG010400, isoform A [Clunio marinus]|uniref:CLUMA_CG010400, isoform A n=1 Tax=Clunio marinus TaxID=568069 RepID=A0A1J1IBR8_9DIPT|nr:CLUMA_CG010400, isoform A [Clunio marinus]